MTDKIKNNGSDKQMDTFSRKLTSLIKPEMNNSTLKNNIKEINQPVEESQKPTNQVKKVLLSEYGYEQAGLNRGSANALENCLNEIREGHVVDVNFSESDHQKRKAEVERKINEKSNAIIDNQGNASSIEKVLIPENKTLIGEKENEINKINIDKIEGRISSDYNKSRHLLYKTLTWLLGIYLVIFYASAIDSAFFRNLLEDLTKKGTSDNVGLIMNSIFNPSALFQFKTSIIFIYFGSSLFFTIGLLAHIRMSRQKDLLGKIIIGIIAFSLPLVADFLIALKIHLNIIDAKALIGILDTTPWYRSANFYLVIVFGYFAYMAWAMIYEESQKEAAKRNTDKVAEYMIKTLKNEIKSLREEIKQMQIRLEELRGIVLKLQLEVETLKSQLNKVLQDPNLLYRNLHNFYEGWLRYLNAGENMEEKVMLCEGNFKNFMIDNFQSQ